MAIFLDREELGKTDLVRRLVKAIGFSGRFMESELNTTDSSTYQPKVVFDAIN